MGGWRKGGKTGLLTSGSADVNVIFLVKPEGRALNVSPGHQRGLVWSRSEGWGVHHSIPPDHPCLQGGRPSLATLPLQHVTKNRSKPNYMDTLK